MSQKSWNKTNATNYEHYSIDYHRKNYDQTTWHWTQIPETVLYESGFVHDFNNLRMKRKERFEEEGTYYNPVREYGLDGISQTIDEDGVVIYNGIQSKLWERSLRAHDLGSFYQVIFARMRKHNNKSKGYLYHNGKLQVDVRDDILNLRGDILNIHLPYNESIQNNFLGNAIVNNVDYDIGEKDYELRDYQREAVEKLNGEWDGIKLLHLPCGTGKTLIFNHHVKDKDYKNVFIISPLKIHTKQNLDRMKPYLPNHKILLLDSDVGGSTDFSDLEKVINDKSIVSTTFDSAQTLFAQFFEEDTQEEKSDQDDEEENEEQEDDEDDEEEKELICKYDLSDSILIVDEAHNLINKDELINVVKAFPKVLLVTATPQSSMEEIIGCEVIYQYPFRKAIEEKHICDYQIYLPIIEKEGNVMIDIPEELLEMNNDNTKKSLFLLNGMLHTGSKKCIVYLTSKEECVDFMKNIMTVNNKYHYLPLWCNKIVSEISDKEREDIIKEFQKDDQDKIKIICSIRILNEGVDIPKCDSIFITQVGDYSNDIVTVQRLCRANRLVKENPNKIANCFMWCDDLSKCVNTLSLLKENDIKFTNKIKYLSGNYDKKCEKKSLELETKENDKLQEFINIKCMNREDIWNIKKNLLFEYVELNKRVPKTHESYKGIKIGEWFHSTQKGNIKSIQNNLYIRLSENKIVKKSLDLYLGIIDDWDEKLKLLFEYCNLYNKIPIQKERYKDILIGSWLMRQKSKLKSINSDLYKKLSENEIIKKNLDDYLNKDNLWDIKKKLLFEFSDLNKRSPLTGEKYKNINIGDWLNCKKSLISSINDKIYQELCKNNYVKTCLDEYLGIIDKWDEKKKILFEYCVLYNKTPTKKDNFKNNNIGKWLHHQKEKIYSDKDELYNKLSKNDIVKKCLDEYLGIINNWEEKKILLFEFFDINKKPPLYSQIYKNIPIGTWFHVQKNNIESKENDIYIKLCKNQYVKLVLDKYLINKIKNKDKKKFTWEEQKEILFNYTILNNETPKEKIQYQECNIGKWFQHQKEKINSINNDVYKQLSENETVKKELDRYLTKKLSK
jgi:superfamily II DNA or RNA helicase